VRFMTVCSAVLVGCLSFLISASRNYSPPKNGIKNSGKTARATYPATDNNPKTASLHTEHRQESTKDDRHQRYERLYWAVTGLATVVAAGAALAAGFYAAHAYREARRQADAAWRAFEASASASVHFGHPVFRLLTVADGTTKTVVEVAIGNDGGTTTSGLTFSTVCVPYLFFPNSDPFDRKRLATARVYHLTLFPKESVLPVACTYSMEQLGMIIGRKEKVVVYGEASYRDTVRPYGRHRLEFCQELYDITFTVSPFNPGPFSMGEECASHNCKDQECEAQGSH
jgi:hypothetical protein